MEDDDIIMSMPKGFEEDLKRIFHKHKVTLFEDDIYENNIYQYTDYHFSFDKKVFYFERVEDIIKELVC